MNDNYELLRIAILSQAVKDYRKALRKKDEAKINYFERWFLSDWGQYLSEDIGEAIIEKCKQRSFSRNHFITIDGVTKTMAEWAKEKGIAVQTISNRINTLGWDEQVAVTTPTKKARGRICLR